MDKLKKTIIIFILQTKGKHLLRSNSKVIKHQLKTVIPQKLGKHLNSF